jgi:hypothetical protein
MNDPSRRDVLVGGLAVAAFALVGAPPRDAVAQGASDREPLNTLLRAEYELVLAYQTIDGYLLTPDMADPLRVMAPPLSSLLGRWRSHHDAHAAAIADAIRAAGGTAVSRSSVTFAAPSGFRLSVGNAMKLLCNKEKAAAVAYVNAAARWRRTGTPPSLPRSAASRASTSPCSTRLCWAR